jgi:hypothetical protein
MRLFVVLTLLCAGVFSSRLEAADSPAGILFLQLRKTGEKIELVDCKSVPGQLKNIENKPLKQGFAFQLLDAGGKVLCQGQFPDPAIRRLESPNPESDTGLSGGHTREDAVEFMLRLPDFPDARRVLFLHVPPGGSSTSLQVVGEAKLTLRRAE